ncbi:MAG: ImmA/IrrE family metallo-endopeptidase [Paracoccaceae bacterium]|nr:ImmA/IrrE family metallo-endopeptidase [Paracoccaceae bacterium]MDE2917808.1 ImmA/IrrE family metallo-endopeptidase [Paracoccaceae bacterium]
MENYIWNKLSFSDRETIIKHNNICPVKLGELAKYLGVKIRVKALNRGISGQISKENDIYVIKVNRYESRERQRFTIAHELAHYFLHRKRIDESGIQDNVLYRSGAPQSEEFEANRLAAELLMPYKLVKAKLEAYNGIINDEIIEQLANDFEVSKGAMEIRLQHI